RPPPQSTAFRRFSRMFLQAIGWTHLTDGVGWLGQKALSPDAPERGCVEGASRTGACCPGHPMALVNRVVSSQVPYLSFSWCRSPPLPFNRVSEKIQGALASRHRTVSTQRKQVPLLRTLESGGRAARASPDAVGEPRVRPSGAAGASVKN